MKGRGRRVIRLSGPRAPLVTAGAAAAGFLLVATVLVPELVIGKEVLPDSWSTVIELGVVFALAALLMRRPSVMERGVNRVFAHGMLAALVVVAFTGAIAGVTTLIYQGGVGVALIAAALVVLTALPLRAYVSQRTDAILFGELDEPYHVITGLGRHLETTAPPDEVLPGVVDTVAH